jgi:hypothetical protein
MQFQKFNFIEKLKLLILAPLGSTLTFKTSTALQKDDYMLKILITYYILNVKIELKEAKMKNLSFVCFFGFHSRL